MATKDRQSHLNSMKHMHGSYTFNTVDDPILSMKNVRYEDIDWNKVEPFVDSTGETEKGGVYKESISNLSDESATLKHEVFRDHLLYLESVKQQYEKYKDSKIESKADLVARSMQSVEKFYVDTLGYDMSWVFHLLEDICLNHSKGREERYSTHEKKVNCAFIHLLVNRGSSETQAMKMLMKLRGDLAVSEGHLRSIREVYREFKDIGIKGYPQKHESDLDNYLDLIPFFLEFNFNEKVLDDEEKSFHKAVEALEAFCSDICQLLDESLGGKDDYTLERWKEYDAPPISRFFKNPCYEEFGVGTIQQDFEDWLYHHICFINDCF